MIDRSLSVKVAELKQKLFYIKREYGLLSKEVDKMEKKLFEAEYKLFWDSKEKEVAQKDDKVLQN